MINIIHSVSIMNRAGQETLLMNLFRQIDKENFSFSFLCSLPYKGEYDDEILSLNGKIHHLKKDHLGSNDFFKYFSFVYDNYKFFCSNRQYNVLHIHNYHSFTSFLQILGAKAAGVKNIILHSHNSSAPHKYLHYIFRLILKLFRVEKFACSLEAAKWMYGSCKGVKIIKNGIISKDFIFNKTNRKLIRTEFNIRDSEILIGHIGRFNYQKNHTFLIDIFKELLDVQNNVKLCLVGEGELEESIKQKIKSLNIENKIIFAGIRSDIVNIYSAFDVFLFPSLFEGLPLVLVEAQANGLPCVISNTISPEAELTKCINKVSLNSSLQNWVNNVLQAASAGRLSTYDDIVSNGYDIITSKNELEKLYKNISHIS